MVQSAHPYTDTFYQKRSSWKSDYRKIADWINKNIPSLTYGDIGCGNGLIVSRLSHLDRKVWGIDQYIPRTRIDSVVRTQVKKVDLTTSVSLPQCETAICFDVVDRIDVNQADVLLGNIISTNAQTIIISASGPGEAGIHHINLQPKTYWIKKLSKRGYFLDIVLTHKFKQDLSKSITHLTWYATDTMIFRKFSKQTMEEAYSLADQALDDAEDRYEILQQRYNQMQEEYYHTAQRLNSILQSSRWKVTNKILKVIGK